MRRLSIDKRAVQKALLAHLNQELEASTRRARDAAQAATHEENRPEDDKDMRSTEASYVARGQAARAEELEAARAQVATMPLRDFGEDDELAASALVEAAHGGGKALYFLVAAAGGVRLRIGSHEVQTLATTSPLGRAMLGLRQGDFADLETPQGTRSYELLRVR